MSFRTDRPKMMHSPVRFGANVTSGGNAISHLNEAKRFRCIRLVGAEADIAKDSTLPLVSSTQPGTVSRPRLSLEKTRRATPARAGPKSSL
jgi:hypothetical protein